MRLGSVCFVVCCVHAVLHWIEILIDILYISFCIYVSTVSSPILPAYQTNGEQRIYLAAKDRDSRDDERDLVEFLIFNN